MDAFESLGNNLLFCESDNCIVLSLTILITGGCVVGTLGVRDTLVGDVLGNSTRVGEEPIKFDTWGKVWYITFGWEFPGSWNDLRELTELIFAEVGNDISLTLDGDWGITRSLVGEVGELMILSGKFKLGFKSLLRINGSSSKSSNLEGESGGVSVVSDIGDVTFGGEESPALDTKGGMFKVGKCCKVERGTLFTMGKTVLFDRELGVTTCWSWELGIAFTIFWAGFGTAVRIFWPPMFGFLTTTVWPDCCLTWKVFDWAGAILICLGALDEFADIDDINCIRPPGSCTSCWPEIFFLKN